VIYRRQTLNGSADAVKEFLPKLKDSNLKNPNEDNSLKIYDFLFTFKI
jgi:hypothetical protein